MLKYAQIKETNKQTKTNCFNQSPLAAGTDTVTVKEK